MKENLSGQTIAVTGATGDIGRAICRRLGGLGARIFACGRRKSALDELVASLGDAGAAASAFVADLSDGAQVAELADTLRAAAPTIDAVVNNAGVARTASIEETSADDLDLHYAINVRAPFLLVKGLLPALQNAHDPRIVNVASVVAHKGYARQGAYAASKHALLGLSKVMASELASKGVLIHVVSPGGVAGDLVQTMRPDIDDAKLMSPYDVADAIAYLLRLDDQVAVDEIRLRRRASAPFA